MLKLGLIGYPLQQSLSPQLHIAAFRAMGLDGEYRLYPAPPLPEGEELLGRFTGLIRTGGMDGLNVTLPHKRTIMRFVDDLTPTAQAIGAVNTIFRQDGKAVGDNTDAPGFILDLQARLENTVTNLDLLSRGDMSAVALVMGAGGAARAVVYALWKAGWQVYLAARRPAQAEEIISHYRQQAEHCNLQSITAMSLTSESLTAFVSSPAGQKIKVIVNATPVGMLPDVDSCPWPEENRLPASAFVYDLINKPPETMLMRRARQAGIETCNGHGMLIEQAALSLERWTGRPAPRQAMQHARSEYLAGSGPLAAHKKNKENR